MASNYSISQAELSIQKQQAERRAQMRKEYIKQKTNPFKHAAEAGYVFDPAIQRYNSMKVTQFDHFTANKRTSLIGICAIIIPMFAYGYAIHKDRSTREAKIRSGELVYKDRLFKLC